MNVFIFPGTAKEGLTFLTEQQAREQGYSHCRLIDVPDAVIVRWKEKPHAEQTQEEMRTYLERLLT